MRDLLEDYLALIDPVVDEVGSREAINEEARGGFYGAGDSGGAGEIYTRPNFEVLRAASSMASRSGSALNQAKKA